MDRKTKLDKTVQWVCAILFAIFSFLFIDLYQGELLALLQDYLSNGMTKSNSLLAALIITLLLMLVQWVINSYSKLHGRWEALSYMPSCLLLALITDVNDNTMVYSANKWLLWVSLGIILYIGVVWLNRMRSGVDKNGPFAVLWPNMLTLSLLFVLVGHISNPSPASHMELAAWSYLHDDEYDEVLEVGLRSDDCNVELTALRNLSLAKTGQLGERLFFYPQRYGANGLIFNKYTKQSKAYGANEFYRHLGGNMPYGGEGGRTYAKRMAIKNDSVIYRDMYLAALLLDKDLDAFVDETVAMLQLDTVFPVHYQEAWILYNELNSDKQLPFVPDSTMMASFMEYRVLQTKHDSVVSENLCRRKYGKTYWCYYDYE